MKYCIPLKVPKHDNFVIFLYNPSLYVYAKMMVKLRLDIGNGNKLEAHTEHTVPNCLCVYVQHTVKMVMLSVPSSSCFAERAAVTCVFNYKL